MFTTVQLLQRSIEYLKEVKSNNGKDIVKKQDEKEKVKHIVINKQT